MYCGLHLQSIRVWHVAREDPKKIHEWYFPVASIKNVTLCRRNVKALFLYVYENSDDFHVFFPSEVHKQRFYDMVIEMIERYDEENHISRVVDLDGDVCHTPIRVQISCGAILNYVFKHMNADCYVSFLKFIERNEK